MSSYQHRKPHVESYDHLISTMGFPILVRWHLYIRVRTCVVGVCGLARQGCMVAIVKPTRGYTCYMPTLPLELGLPAGSDNQQQQAADILYHTLGKSILHSNLVKSRLSITYNLYTLHCTSPLGRSRPQTPQSRHHIPYPARKLTGCLLGAQSPYSSFHMAVLYAITCYKQCILSVFQHRFDKLVGQYYQKVWLTVNLNWLRYWFGNYFGKATYT